MRGAFNVQDIGGTAYVTYAPAGLLAQRNATRSMGFVSAFDENGTFLRTVVSGSRLAAPWGVALAPTGFGPFGGDLLVGNFSDDDDRPAGAVRLPSPANRRGQARLALKQRAPVDVRRNGRPACGTSA